MKPYKSSETKFPAILNKSRAITHKCLEGFGWLSNLTEILCQRTLLPSLTRIDEAIKSYQPETKLRAGLTDGRTN